MGRDTASSGRCRPQTLQRFLSLGFNSMLPACHSDLRSVPVIRTAFKAGPKQQSCLRGGRCREGVMERGGGAHEPMRCTFKLTRGRYIFTFLLTLPRLIGEGDGGRGSFVFLDLFFFFYPLHKFLFPLTPLLQSACVTGRLFWLTTVLCYQSFSPGGVEGGRLIFWPLQTLANT